MKNERRRNRELETLSAYLDSELSPNQRQALEARFQSEPELRDQLENLRKIKITLAYLPHQRAPRNYTLTPEMVSVRSQKKQPIFGTLRLASALAAILLVVLFSVEFLFTSGPLARPQLGAKPMLDEYYAMDAAVVADEPEPLILWGEPGVGAGEGYINGRGGDPEIMEESVMVEAMPVEPEVAVEEELPPEDAPELMAEAEAIPPSEDEVDTLQIATADEKELPILGINPEESGEIVSRYTDTFTEEIPQPTWRVVVRILQIAMGAVLVGGGLAWWLLRRHGWG